MGCGIEPRKIRHCRGWKFSLARRQHFAAPLCEVLTPCRGPRPHHVQRNRIGSWEISGLTGTAPPLPARIGKVRNVADNARTREVGPRHSSWEAGEQSGAIRRGVGGAKGGDQGECVPAKHVPDTEPGKRVTGAGTHTASIGRHTPEVGAVCGKAARTVLCGGRAMKPTSLPLHRREFITLLGRAVSLFLCVSFSGGGYPNYKTVHRRFQT